MSCSSISLRNPAASTRQILLASLLLILLAACDRPVTTRIGDRFPVESLAMTAALEPSTVDLAGKALLVNFWATWCEPCRKEMPELQRLAADLDPDRFAVIGVSIDMDDNLAREFLLEYRIDFPNRHDPDRLLAGDSLGIMSYPQTFLVSPDGVIIDRITTAFTADHAALVAWRERPALRVRGKATGGS